MSGQRPEEKVRLGLLQRWRDVAFLHWAVDEGHTASVLPGRLRPDPLDGRHWISVVVFSVERCSVPGPSPVALRWGPFGELNVRTYVRRRTKDGLWFTGLWTDDTPTLLGGRAVGAPYRRAEVTVARSGSQLTYSCAPPGQLACSIALQLPGAEPTSDVPELDAGLLGRWRAYTAVPGGLLCVPVRHQPWAVQRVHEVSFRPGHLAAQLPDRPPDVCHWSPGVDAVLGAPRPG